MILGQPIPEDTTGGPLVARRYDTLRVLGQDIVQVPSDMLHIGQVPLVPADACTAAIEREVIATRHRAAIRAAGVAGLCALGAFFLGRRHGRMERQHA